MSPLECSLSKLTETLERVAAVWERDLRWRQSHESRISREDQEAMARSLFKANRIARRLGAVAHKLAALDASTTPTANNNER